MEKIIKHRLFTWFEEMPNPLMPDGPAVFTERIAHFGEKIDVTNPAMVQRGEALGSFYTEEEAQAIEDGTYNGPDRELLFNTLSGLGKPVPLVQAADGEHGDVSSMTSDQLGEYIATNQLNVEGTLALVPDDADTDTLNKFLDAENLATENEPRKGVTSVLERRLAEATSG